MDKKTLPLIIILAILVFAYWPILEFLGLTPPPAEPGLESQDSAITQPATIPDQNLAVITPDQTLSPAVTPPVAEVDTTVVDSIVVNTNKFSITLSSRGGGPVSVILKEHSLRDGTPIEMMPGATSATPETRFANGSYTTSNLHFVSDLAPREYQVTSGSELELSYTYTLESGAQIVRHYTFYADRYHYDLDFTVSDPAAFGFERNYQLNWNTPMGVAEPFPKTDYDAMQAVAMQGGSRETLDDFENGRLNQELEGNTTWAGLRNMYFSAVMIPQSRDAELVIAEGVANELKVGDEMMEVRRITVALQMPFVSSAPILDSYTIFVGPMDYLLLSEYDVALEDMLDIGTTPVIGWLIKPFAIGIIWLLPRMYSVVPNYGLVIILFALLVKLVTLPLSKKQFLSMQAMKQLSPQIEKLKAQHKKNPQQLNKETMKLYKKHGVNPMSSCLPMLPQMPLFFAMFSVFKATILLRGADFVWFIDDLSRGATSLTDPYIVLVVIMMIGQFASQQLTMGATQQNKMMMYMMPLVMGYIFHTFAAGLVLYWSCFSIFSLLDYVLFKRKVINPQVHTS